MNPFSIPDVRVDVVRLPQLTPWGLWYHLTRKGLFNDWPQHAHSRDKPPHWTIQLEAYYQRFHPDIWPILDADDDLDARAMRDLDARIAALAQVEGDAAEDETRRLQEALCAVRSRRSKRWYAFYGLHKQRVAFLAWFAQYRPRLSQQEILSKHTQAGYLGRLRPVRSRSLWPIPLPPPAEDNLVTLSMFGRVDWKQYLLPDMPSAKADAPRRLGIQLDGPPAHSSSGSGASDTPPGSAEREAAGTAAPSEEAPAAPGISALVSGGAKRRAVH
ncbi:hypothetical protein JCM10449v2_005534 [Rhodotorula kratochvilovae]